MNRFLPNFDAMYRGIAQKFSACALRCEACGKEEYPTVDTIEVYLKQGWPKHCGKTMAAVLPERQGHA